MCSCFACKLRADIVCTLYSAIMLFNSVLLKMYIRDPYLFEDINLRFTEEADPIQCDANQRKEGKKGYIAYAPVNGHYTTWEGDHFLIWRTLDKTLACRIHSGSGELHHYTTTTGDGTYAIYMARQDY